MEAEVSDIDLILSKAAPGVPSFLYGHSMGGGMVLYYGIFAENAPTIAGIVATGPCILTVGGPNLFVKKMGILASHFIPSFLMHNGLDLDKLCHDPQVVEDYKKDPLNHEYVSLSLGAILLGFDKVLIENAPRLKTPVLLIHGSDDVFTNPEGSKMFFENVQIKDKKIMIEEGLYHEIHQEPQKDEILARVVQWFREHH